MSYGRPVWAEVSASALRWNFERLRGVAAAQGATVLSVIKADAYGHSAEICAPILVAAGTEWLGVTDVKEGVRVRRLCPDVEILVMGGIWEGEAEVLMDHRLTPVVWEEFHLDWLEATVRRRGGSFIGKNGGYPVHLEIDTGMSRQGVGLQDRSRFERILGRFSRRLSASNISLSGISTHFASPELNSGQTEKQFSRFADVIAEIRAMGLAPEWVHAGNSTSLVSGMGLERLAELAASVGARAMVRPGLALYGYCAAMEECGDSSASPQNDKAKYRGPSAAPQDDGLGKGAAVSASAAAGPSAAPLRGSAQDDTVGGLRPVMEWKTRIVSVREIEAGDSVGYGAAFTARRTMRLGLLPVGYADGLRRELSGTDALPGQQQSGAVLVRGQRAAIVGRVSMDLTVVDLTEIPEAGIGDEVALIGEQGGQRVTADDHARLAGTIPYEILCGISDRVLRVVVPL